MQISVYRRKWKKSIAIGYIRSDPYTTRAPIKLDPYPNWMAPDKVERTLLLPLSLSNGREENEVDMSAVATAGSPAAVSFLGGRWREIERRPLAVPLTRGGGRGSVVCMAPEEKKMTRRSPLVFPIVSFSLT